MSKTFPETFLTDEKHHPVTFRHLPSAANQPDLPHNMNTTIARSALLASFILSGVLSAPSLVADTAIYDLSTIVTTSGDGQNTWSAPTNVANSGGVEGTLATSGQKLTYNWTV
ncbi:MAG: hypothetical protein LBK99_24045, partial [Opitutaceae bacterium]|nr:hypothetical protein [Opitutaceae bacterium]